jgi:hypothetical protein
MALRINLFPENLSQYQKRRKALTLNQFRRRKFPDMNFAGPTALGEHTFGDFHATCLI